MEHLFILDFVLPPFLLLIIFLHCSRIKSKYAKTHEEYNYYARALGIKIFGATAFLLVYLFYYGGGDTINYFESAVTINKLMFKNFSEFVTFYSGNFDLKSASFFDHETGTPIYSLADHAAIFTCKFYTPIVLVSGFSFVTSTILAAVISFTGLWKLYRVFIYEFPNLKKQLFIAIFMVPSVFFWGSGIMKDSIAISAVGWYLFALHSYFIRKRRRTIYIAELVIASYLILSIKPYILFALLPGSILWLSNQTAQRFKNRLVRRVFSPLLLVIGAGLAYYALNQIDEMLGLYKVDSVTERAVIVNRDMQMSYYGGKSFSLGDYDANISGLLSVAHKAVFAALFRPTIIDAQNAVMLFSALENAYLLMLTIVLLIRLKFFGFFRFIGEHPLLMFAVLFSLFFSFSVGVSISNFGSLVRLRIPALPFFVSSLFIIRSLYEKKYNVKMRI
ncbi:MAG TPA: hypothetical protein VK177_11710 [Flavobacteriales bacterium]|nr:hypothetical protein [Flavobacteriales bacterium]